MENQSNIQPAHYEGFDQPTEETKPQDYDSLLKDYRELFNNYEQLKHAYEHMNRAFNQAMAIIGNKYAQEVADAIFKQLDEKTGA